VVLVANAVETENPILRPGETNEKLAVEIKSYVIRFVLRYSLSFNFIRSREDSVC